MKTKNAIITTAIVILVQLFTSQGIAQETKTFNIVKESWASPIKSQGETGLCALFSDISFLESELHRLDKGKLELSTMQGS